MAIARCRLSVPQDRLLRAPGSGVRPPELNFANAQWHARALCAYMYMGLDWVMVVHVHVHIM